MSQLFAGLDLGQANDYTALAVVEAIPTTYQQEIAYFDHEYRVPASRKVPVEGFPMTYHVRHLERYPLGMTYPAMVNDVRQKMAKLPGVTLAIDHTGCGRPVFDLFEAAGLSPIGITITGGDTPHGEGRAWRVPKRDLVGVLQVSFQGNRLKVSKKLSESRTLVEELLNFRVKINLRTAHDSYEAWREGVHDDLILAVSLACWTAALAYTYREEVVEYYEPVRISPF